MSSPSQKLRPVRSQIYLPIVKWGVAHTDWKYVGIFSALAYIIPFILDLKIGRVPLPMWTGLLTLALSIAFFNYVRVGRPPLWLNHVVASLLDSILYGPDYLRTSYQHERRRAARTIIQTERKVKA